MFPTFAFQLRSVKHAGKNYSYMGYSQNHGPVRVPHSWVPKWDPNFGNPPHGAKSSDPCNQKRAVRRIAVKDFRVWVVL